MGINKKEIYLIYLYHLYYKSISLKITTCQVTNKTIMMLYILMTVITNIMIVYYPQDTEIHSLNNTDKAKEYLMVVNIHNLTSIKFSKKLNNNTKYIKHKVILSILMYRLINSSPHKINQINKQKYSIRK